MGGKRTWRILLAETDRANPLAPVLSAAMMLEITCGLAEAGAAVRRAVGEVLEEGYRTADIMEKGGRPVSCREMGGRGLER